MARSDITFTPALQLLSQQRTMEPYTVFAGANNSGKSLTLRSLKYALGRSAYFVGSNRFYHVYHFSTGLRDTSELDRLENDFQNSWNSESHNYENNVFDLNRIIMGLADVRRKKLFELCGELLQAKIEMRRVEADNDLSPRYIDIDGQNLSTGSTGTRLLMTLLGLCMDDRFSTMLIDEPELGFSPKLQGTLAAFLQDSEQRAKYFPHLQRVFVATHSHVFLSRRDIKDNYVVSKVGNAVTLTRVQNWSDYHTLQFNLLGNSLESLYFPAAIVIVEGKSDLDYIRKVIDLQFPGRRVTVVPSNGDPKSKVHSLREVLGDIHTSPFRNRLFVVSDKVHSPGLKEALEKLGLPSGHFVCWSQNGIEYLYPQQILSEIFGGVGGDSLLQLEGDRVSANGVSKTKADLAVEVVRRLSAATELPAEFHDKLLTPIRAAIE